MGDLAKALEENDKKQGGLGDALDALDGQQQGGLGDALDALEEDNVAGTVKNAPAPEPLQPSSEKPDYKSIIGSMQETGILPQPLGFWKQLIRNTAEGMAFQERAEEKHIEMTLALLKEVNRPINAVWSGIVADAKADHDLTARLFAAKPRFETVPPFFRGAVDGWNYKDGFVNFTDALDAAYLTEEQIAVRDRWFANHPIPRYINTASDLILNIAAEALVEGVVIGAIVPPVKRFAIRGAYKVKPDLYMTTYWDKMFVADDIARKGPSAIIDNMATRSHKFVKPGMKVTTDDVLRWHFANDDSIQQAIGRNAELLMQGRKMIATKAVPTPADIKKVGIRVLAKEKSIDKLTKKIADVTDIKIQKYTDEIAELTRPKTSMDIQNADSIMKSWRAVKTKQERLASWKRIKEHELEHVASLSNDISSLKRSLEYTPILDTQKASRALRESAIDKYIRVSETIELTRPAADIATRVRISDALRPEFDEAIKSLPPGIRNRLSKLRLVKDNVVRMGVKDVDGLYIPKTGKLTLRKGWREAAPDTLAHEIVHAGLDDFGPDDLPFVRDFLETQSDFLKARFKAGDSLAGQRRLTKMLDEATMLAASGKNPTQLGELAEESIVNAITDYVFNPGKMDKGLSAVIEKHLVDTHRLSGSKVQSSVDEIIKSVSFGRAKTLSELSEEQFAQAFGFVDYMARNPSSFKFRTGVPKAQAKGLLAKAWPFRWRGNLRVVPPWYNKWAPVDIWFERAGARKVIEPLIAGDVERMQLAIKYADSWNEVLEGFGKKAAKNVELQRHIFKAAKGDYAHIRRFVKNGTLTPQEGVQIIKAGQRANEIFDEVADMFEAAHRWGDGLKRQRRYMPDIVLRGVDENVEEVIEHGAKRFKIKDRNAVLAIERMKAPYEDVLGKRIDIHEFVNKVKHRHEILENANASLQAGLRHELYKLKMEPAIFRSTGMAEMTGNQDVINKTFNFIKYGIKGEMATPERWFESSFHTMAKGLEYGSKIIPGYNFVAADRATRQLCNGWRKLTYHGAMWGRPIPTIRNSFQHLLDVPLVGVGNMWWGSRSIFTEGGQQLATKHCRLLIGRVPHDYLDPFSFGRFATAGHKGFRFADACNIKQNFNADCRYLISTRKDWIKTVEKHGVFKGGNIDEAAKTISRAFDAGDLDIVKQIANDMVRTTQYSYRPTGMAEVSYMFGPAGKAATQFLSWPQNYFFGYLPKVAEAGLTGIGPAGEALTWGQRQGLLKVAGMGATLYLAGRAMGVDFGKLTAAGAVPATLAPAYKFVQGGVKMVLGGGKAVGSLGEDTRLYNEGVRDVEQSMTFAKIKMVGGVLPVPYPSPLAAREAWDVIIGEKKPIHLLFPEFREKTKPVKESPASHRRRLLKRSR